MRRIILSMFLIIMPMCAAMADTVSSDIKQIWGYNSWDVSNGSAEDFILGGAIGKEIKSFMGTVINRGPIDCTLAQANQTKTYGVIGAVAHRIVEHGAYFCTSEVVCDSNSNRYPRSKVWFSWYAPEVGSNCAWFCDEGYGGEGCAPVSETLCDNKESNTYFPSNLAMKYNHTSFKAKNSCKTVSKIDSSILFFEEKTKPGRGVVLGVIKRLKHGVIAAPVKLECADRKDRKAWIEGVSLGDGKQRVLCAAGYRPVDNDCVVIDAEVCANPNVLPCDGFPTDKFDATIHTRSLGKDKSDKNCWKYLCTDTAKAFASATDTTCSVTCGTDNRSGIDTTTGLCKKCEVGKVFNKADNDCVDAVSYTKDELQYGDEKYTADKEIDQQCWTMFGDLYKFCIPKR